MSILLILALVGSAVSKSDIAWGVATAAYQIEGGWNSDGRGPSIWDDFSHLNGTTNNGDNGDVADDHFHKFEDDIKNLSALGIKNYRFSLSWSRLLPVGTTDVVN